MNIRARIENDPAGEQRVTLSTEGRAHTLDVPARATGPGSSVNGGELLFLALATCYCNDLYREAARRGIEVRGVEVEVEGEFGGPGEPARHVTYRAKVSARAGQEEIEALARHTDTVAEIHNTLRQGVPVHLAGFQAETVG